MKELGELFKWSGKDKEGNKVKQYSRICQTGYQ